MLLLGHWLPLRGSALRPGLCCMWGVCGVYVGYVGSVWGVWGGFVCGVCGVCVGFV